MRKIFRISNLKYLIAFLLPLIFVMMINQGLDNDSWGVLAEGRYIANNGVYYTDVLSMHEGLNTIVQNYGFAVLFYWIFEFFGGPGLYVVMLILNFLVCFFIYKISMLISKNNKSLSLLIMMITAMTLVMFGFVVTRAQMVSYVIFLALIYVLELYAKSGKMKYLWWVPVLSLVQVNLHASLWPMIFLVMLTYVVDSFVKFKFLHKEKYKIGPLLIVGMISFIVGFLNPYGVNMMTIMFRVYGDAKFSNAVSELNPFRPFATAGGALFYILLSLTIVLYIFGKRQNVRVRYLLMLFGFLALGLNTIKGMSQVILVMFFPLALLYKDVKIGKIIDSDIGNNALIMWSGILVSIVFISVCPAVVLNVSSDYPRIALVEAIDVIDSYEEKDEGSLKIYSRYNIGGYVEYRGYRPYMDPRGGDFMKKINGKEDIFEEYIDFKNRKIAKDDFLDKYNFDYILVDGEDEPFYNYVDEKYEKVYKNEEDRLELYKRKNTN